MTMYLAVKSIYTVKLILYKETVSMDTSCFLPLTSRNCKQKYKFYICLQGLFSTILDSCYVLKEISKFIKKHHIRDKRKACPSVESAITRKDTNTCYYLAKHDMINSSDNVYPV